MQDGIHGRVPREKMSEGVGRYWDFFTRKPGARLYRAEFGFYCLDKWRREEGLAEDADLSALFGLDESGVTMLRGLGGCEAAFAPAFEEKVLEDRGAYELVQDAAGRQVLCFKNRRDGFMPQYLAHPVTDRRSWEENCKWRMDPNAPERTRAMEAYMPGIVAQARRGCVVEQYMVGGYMYLRSLMGPEGLLYMFYDDPELIEECMKAWFTLADTMIARHQQQVSLDEILLDEDICYKQGSLISPEMIRKFLLPYYEQLIQNARRRQLDSKRPIQYHVGSDGHFDAVIPLYQQTGMNFLSPFEVAADSDVVRTGREYPELLISGGMDKREMSRGHDAIDRMIDRILPVMQARGGYFPTCDHGVPEEVSLENYMYYRTRCQAF